MIERSVRRLRTGSQAVVAARPFLQNHLLGQQLVFYSESDTRRYDRDGDGGGEGMGEASRNFHNEAKNESEPPLPSRSDRIISVGGTRRPQQVSGAEGIREVSCSPSTQQMPPPSVSKNTIRKARLVVARRRSRVPCGMTVQVVRPVASTSRSVSNTCSTIVPSGVSVVPLRRSRHYRQNATCSLDARLRTDGRTDDSLPIAPPLEPPAAPHPARPAEPRKFRKCDNRDGQDPTKTPNSIREAAVSPPPRGREGF
ncbi:hypothetical protein GEV33_009369 [Tenebrio molitor]|uniref:Uncharacterized protein n=1 Tax=Tenebrio molitor TaxID=7067 RepID=A0A8J6HEX5_TENMO|nr:hypothetical protein GEV33_009369 [Tenebrio molitor]